MNPTTSISKLTSGNYFTWASQVEIQLEQKKFLKFVTNADFETWYEKLPISDQRQRYNAKLAEIHAKLPVMTPDAEKEKRDGEIDRLETLFHNDLSIWSNEKYKKQSLWDEEEASCRGFLKSLVSDSYLFALKDLNSREIWEKLKELSSATDISTVILLHQQLFRAELSTGESLISFLDRVISITEKLKGIGEPFREPLACIIILASLPDEYDTITMALYQIPEPMKKLTFDLLRVKFAAEDARAATTQQRQHAANEKANHANLKRTCTGCSKALPKFHPPKHRFCDTCFEERKSQNRKPSSNSATADNSTTASSSTTNPKASALCFNTRFAPNRNSVWYLDSACTSHMSFEVDSMINPVPSSLKIEGPSGESIPVRCTGQYKFAVQGREPVILTNVLCSPALCRNLMSVPCLAQNGCRIHFEGDSVCVYFESRAVLFGSLNEEMLYAMSHDPPPASFSTTSAPIKLSFEDLHARLGHLHPTRIAQLINNGAITGVALLGQIPSDFHCSTCETAKMSRTPFSDHKEWGASEPGHVLHSDVCGKISPQSIGGNNYFILVIDDHTEYQFVKVAEKKSEAFEFIKSTRKFLRNHGFSVLKFVSDGGGEYNSNKFEEYLNRKGIKHAVTSPHTPQLNPKAERANRTVMETVRCLLIQSGMPLTFWGEAVCHAVYLHNRLPTTRHPNTTPFERMFGAKPAISMMHVFGCPVTYANTGEKSKLDPRAYTGYYCGVNEGDSTYRVYDPILRRMISTRDCKFRPSSGTSTDWTSHGSSHVELQIESPSQVISIPDEDEDNYRLQPLPSIPAPDHAPVEIEPAQVIVIDDGPDVPADLPQQPLVIVTDDTRHIQPQPIQPRFSSQKASEDRDYWRAHASDKLPGSKQRKSTATSLATTTALPDPDSYKDAMNSSAAAEWEAAMQREMQSLSEMGTWELVDRPVKPVVRSRWCFKAKVDEFGKIARYKARVVAKGFTQQYGVDYSETFAPVLRHESLRFLISYATSHQLDMQQLDVDSAFLNGDLLEEVYMELPEGYPERATKVALLRKSIYGLKQAAHCWNTKFVASLLKHGFTQSQADPCVFINRTNGDTTLLGLFVDDMIIAGEAERVRHIKDQLMSEYRMKDLGRPSLILGIKVDHSVGSTSISQRQYTENLLATFGMSECKPAATPIPANLGSEFEDTTACDLHLYQQAIGSLIYLSNSTRPDISYAVGLLARKMANPTEGDWKMVKHVLRYLRGTPSASISYSAEPVKRDTLVGYSDASYAENPTDRKSTGGYVFLFNDGAISWRSVKQPIVALSSTEAEYIALTDSFKEAQWLQHLLQEVFSSPQLPTVIFEDNQSTIKLARNKAHSNRTKHIDVRYHYVREVIQRGQLILKYCPTESMTADIMTKPLGKILHMRHCSGMGVNF